MLRPSPSIVCLCIQVEKYYTGPESSPTGYPLPAVSEYEDSNHAPPVDVKARRGPLAVGSTLFLVALLRLAGGLCGNMLHEATCLTLSQEDFGHSGTLCF